MDRPWCGGLWLELHAGRLVELLAAGLPDIEEFALSEAHILREEDGRERLERRVVLAHGVVEEAPCGGQLVLDIREIALELLEIRIRLQVRIGLGQCEQLPESAGQRPFGGRLLRRPRRTYCGVAG